MLADKPVLIVESNIYLALDLCSEVEGMNGRVLGPVDNVADALAVLDREPVAGAVLGFHGPDCAMRAVAAALVARRVPFVVHADDQLPAAVAGLRPGTPVLIKPVQPRDVVSVLAQEVLRREMDDDARA